MEKKEQITDSGYVLLANAIIEQACADYRKAIKDIKEMASPEAFDIIRKRAKRSMKLKRELSDEECAIKQIQMVEVSEKEISDCRRFFRSQQFEGLTGLDGECLIKKLEQEC